MGGIIGKVRRGVFSKLLCSKDLQQDKPPKVGAYYQIPSVQLGF